MFDLLCEEGRPILSWLGGGGGRAPPPTHSGQRSQVTLPLPPPPPANCMLVNIPCTTHSMPESLNIKRRVTPAVLRWQCTWWVILSSKFEAEIQWSTRESSLFKLVYVSQILISKTASDLCDNLRQNDASNHWNPMKNDGLGASFDYVLWKWRRWSCSGRISILKRHSQIMRHVKMVCELALIRRP
jgi:hypothetical protein